MDLVKKVLKQAIPLNAQKLFIAKNAINKRSRKFCAGRENRTLVYTLEVCHATTIPYPLISYYTHNLLF